MESLFPRRWISFGYDHIETMKSYWSDAYSCNVVVKSNLSDNVYDQIMQKIKQKTTRIHDDHQCYPRT